MPKYIVFSGFPGCLPDSHTVCDTLAEVRSACRYFTEQDQDSEFAHKYKIWTPLNQIRAKNIRLAGVIYAQESGQGTHRVTIEEYVEEDGNEY